MFSSWPALGFRRRTEDGGLEPFALAKVSRQRFAGQRAGGAVLLPRRPRQVAAHDALHRKDVGAAAEHRAAGERRSVIGKRWHLGDDLVDVRREHVMVHEALELPEPPRRDLCENRALVRNGLGHHDVEGADAIGGDEQQAVVVDDVDLAHLAASQVAQGNAGELGHGHTRTSSASVCRTCSRASNGSTTSRRNSSTCSAARPTKRCGSRAASRSPIGTPSSRSAASRSSRSLRSAPSLSGARRFDAVAPNAFVRDLPVAAGVHGAHDQLLGRHERQLVGEPPANARADAPRGRARRSPSARESRRWRGSSPESRGGDSRCRRACARRTACRA